MSIAARQDRTLLGIRVPLRHRVEPRVADKPREYDFDYDYDSRDDDFDDDFFYGNFPSR